MGERIGTVRGGVVKDFRKMGARILSFSWLEGTGGTGVFMGCGEFYFPFFSLELLATPHPAFNRGFQTGGFELGF